MNMVQFPFSKIFLFDAGKKSKMPLCQASSHDLSVKSSSVERIVINSGLIYG